MFYWEKQQISLKLLLISEPTVSQFKNKKEDRLCQEGDYKDAGHSSLPAI